MNEQANKGMTKCEKLGITLSVNEQANKGMTKCEKQGITLSVNEQANKGMTKCEKLGITQCEWTEVNLPNGAVYMRYKV